MPPEIDVSVGLLAPKGDVDLDTARGLGLSLSELAGSPGNAVLDLSAVGFMDSVGLSVVLNAANRFRRQGKRLVLVVPPGGPVARVLDAAGMHGRLVVA